MQNTNQRDEQDTKVRFDLTSSVTYNDTRPAAVRLMDEVDELGDALSANDKAMILDELVDVIYYCFKVAETYGIDADTISNYQRMKAVSRRVVGKSKSHELMLAHTFVDIASDRASGR